LRDFIGQKNCINLPKLEPSSTAEIIADPIKSADFIAHASYNNQPIFVGRQNRLSDIGFRLPVPNDFYSSLFSSTI